jgi:ABC-type transport system involved in multi-copper enzyme maturation permease subunit
MAIMDEVGLTAAREMRKNLRSTKGIAMFALFVLGGVGASLIYLQLSRYLMGQATEKVGAVTDEMLRKGKLEALTQGFPEATANYLVDCPTVLLFLFKGTLLALPLLILMIGFDSIAGETQHRTLRYLAPRAHRGSIVVGKALGLWAVTAVMVAVLHVTVWGMLIIDGSEKLAAVASWGGRLWVFAVLYAGAYVGLSVLISSFFRVPVVALFVGAGLIFTMGVTSLILGHFDSTKSLVYAFPSNYDMWLVSHDPMRVAGAVGFLLAWGAACLTLTTEIVRRRDV